MICFTSGHGRTQSLGLVLYEGPSLLDGSPIVAVATGFRRRSRNEKTGDMVQTWVLPADLAPTVAVNTGADFAVCGNCPLRGVIQDGRNVLRSCYVQLRNAPYQVYRAHLAGSYDRYEPRQHNQLFCGRKLRIGSFGDPCAVPFRAWKRLVDLATGHTAYTHQWQDGRFWRFRFIAMASCETPEQAQEAHRRGWRSFRTLSDAKDLTRGEILCPASAEAGKRRQCETCLACDGGGSNPSRVSIAIVAHGSPAVIRSYSRLAQS